MREFPFAVEKTREIKSGRRTISLRLDAGSGGANVMGGEGPGSLIASITNW